MALQAAAAVENNFKQGLLTEYSGMNFPENGCTETYDCIFNLNGTVERRLGIDFEENYVEKSIDRTDCAISTYLWKNVSGDGNVTLYVTQVGGSVYFYETSATSVSGGAVSSHIDLSSYLASGAPSPNSIECQFSSGNKYLIITHPYCDPIRVSYDPSSQTASAVALDLKIRDFEGDTADALAVDTRPTTTLAAMNVHHYYNLLNQGWTVTNLTAWDTARTDMPSNVDQMKIFKNSSDAFDMSTVANAMQGNSKAPNGHFILSLSTQNRDTASGLSGTTAGGTSYQRPSTSAWFGGRVFFSGINYANRNSSILFTQILESDAQYSLCYQVNDPTSELLFDLLPTDGGVITIPEAGTIFKIFAISGALLVFANNGVWAITGSTGLGFKADDYTIQKLTTVNAISASSFVDVSGFPAWWNNDGIHIVAIDGNGGAPQIKSLTLTTIKSFYDDIPTSSKFYARGFYHAVTGVVQWIFRSTSAATPTETYEFDTILNLNTVTGAFYPWRVSASAAKMSSIVVLDGTQGILNTYNINDDSSNLIVDDSSNQIISFDFQATGGGSIPKFKYLVSYPSSGTYKFVLAEENSSEYLDWKSLDTVGVAYTSYFITGFKIRGQGLRKFQTTWVNIFSETSEAVAYYFQGLWDYAITGSTTGRWSSKQFVQHTDTDYSNAIRRLKVRGHGKVLQFKVESISGFPFRILGWATLDTGNSLP